MKQMSMFGNVHFTMSKFGFRVYVLQYYCCILPLLLLLRWFLPQFFPVLRAIFTMWIMQNLD